MENGGKEIGFLAIPSWQESNLRKATDDLAPLRGWGAKGEKQDCVLVLLSLLSCPSYSIYIVTIRHPPTFVVALFIPQVWMINSNLRTGQFPEKDRYPYLHRGIVKYFCNQHRAYIILLYTVFTTNLRCYTSLIHSVRCPPNSHLWCLHHDIIVRCVDMQHQHGQKQPSDPELSVKALHFSLPRLPFSLLPHTRLPALLPYSLLNLYFLTTGSFGPRQLWSRDPLDQPVLGV